ncbi:MAG: VIT family protein [Rubritepida sp.]|nr:VIT family protein [Rubritepida sp.]
MAHRESHLVHRIGWLRAAVLGANDGILSTGSLIVGVAASAASPQQILIAGAARLVAGAMSMAAGEYVSVSSQADTEAADMARERQELADDPEHETAELAQIYVGRGVEPGLARQVATQLMAHDALGTHAREELGITEITASRPVTAALASAASFAVGGVLPLAVVFVSPTTWLAFLVTAVSLGALALLGVVGALAGGAPLRAAVMRVVFWGAAAMALTAAIGALVGRAV